jgi:hypothetical protein
MTHYCPNGDGAFDDWVGSCPECGSILQDAPPDDDELVADPADSNPAWLVSVPNEIEANLIAGILRDSGLAVLVRPGGPGLGAWASAATFEHAIYVRHADLDRARTILDETTVIDESEWDTELD